MPFQPGQSGNPRGRQPHKPFTEALQRALEQYNKGGVAQGKALRALADKLIEQALDGNTTAQKELLDRLQGKAHQSIDVAGTLEMSYEERLKGLMEK